MRKFCKKCQTEKLKSDFYKDNSKHDGLKHQCKDCDKKARRIHIANNPEKYLERGRKDYLKKLGLQDK